MDGRTDGRTDGRMVGQMAGQMDGRADILLLRGRGLVDLEDRGGRRGRGFRGAVLDGQGELLEAVLSATAVTSNLGARRGRFDTR